MELEVRAVRDDELAAWVDILAAAFLDRVDAGALVGTARTWATELTVPGRATLPASAVSAVAVRPTHRRRGILRRLMNGEHAAARGRGEAVMVLYSAEYPIYGRFGYGPACQLVEWTFETKRSAVVSPRPDPGSAHLLAPSPEIVADLIRVHDAWRKGQPGEIRRRDYFWDYDLGLRPSPWPDAWKGFLVVHRDARGEVDGFARYSGEDKWERFMPQGIVTIDDLYALTDDAYDALWGYFGGLDIAATVKAPRRRIHERLPWLLENARAAQVTALVDGMWVKLLDLPRALAARTYERSGSLVIEAVEDAGTEGEARTRVALDAGPDGATCELTTRSVDLTVDSGALGAAYLGGTRLRDAVVPRGVDEHRAGALAAAESLFRTVDPPWCSTFF